MAARSATARAQQAASPSIAQCLEAANCIGVDEPDIVAGACGPSGTGFAPTAAQSLFT